MGARAAPPGAVCRARRLQEAAALPGNLLQGGRQQPRTTRARVHQREGSRGGGGVPCDVALAACMQLWLLKIERETKR